MTFSKISELAGLPKGRLPGRFVIETSIDNATMAAVVGFLAERHYAVTNERGTGDPKDRRSIGHADKVRLVCVRHRRSNERVDGFSENEAENKVEKQDYHET